MSKIQRKAVPGKGMFLHAHQLPIQDGSHPLDLLVHWCHFGLVISSTHYRTAVYAAASVTGYSQRLRRFFLPVYSLFFSPWRINGLASRAEGLLTGDGIWVDAGSNELCLGEMRDELLDYRSKLS